MNPSSCDLQLGSVHFQGRDLVVLVEAAASVDVVVVVEAAGRALARARFVVAGRGDGGLAESESVITTGVVEELGRRRRGRVVEDEGAVPAFGVGTGSCVVSWAGGCGESDSEMMVMARRVRGDRLVVVTVLGDLGRMRRCRVVDVDTCAAVGAWVGIDGGLPLIGWVG